MALAADFGSVFNELTGTALANYGSHAGAYAESQGAESTHWSWHPNTGPFVGYFDSVTKTTTNMPFFSTTASVPSAVLESIGLAIAFNLRSLSTSNNTHLCGVTNSTTDGGLSVYTNTPSAGGDFDLLADLRDSGGTQSLITFTGCTFNTDFQIACSVNVATPSASQLIARLNSTTQTPATINCSGHTWEAAWPLLLRRSDFNNYFGLDGKYYYYWYKRGGTAWTATDLSNINTSPSTAFIGWPSGGTSLALMAQACF